MFGISQIARYARQWQTNRTRAAMENMILNLPPELQKDIGWPSLMVHPSSTMTQSDIHACPIR